ncbi:hypothetical protein FNV43_RR15752 [Rhamnella rubrinervis]|uniref:Ubiquitin-like domain-containing protein n=1 Tax=Rhamnella rubrinervis TaxID=2594499 RepID=A0A8K0GUJ7_9ROSA|nr:hypothetical protein FNV43_RR15752 [Rhamnella rubrinervis]
MPITASVLQVKHRIKEITKIEENRQQLFYNLVTLKDDTEQLDYVLWQPHTNLELSVYPLSENRRFVIVAKSQNREDDPIIVKETQSVDHLRNKIARRWGISPPTNITLLRLGHQMEDGYPLSDYLICKGVEIDVLVHNA